MEVKSSGGGGGGGVVMLCYDNYQESLSYFQVTIIIFFFKLGII